MEFESARHDQPAKKFKNLQEALEFISESTENQTRPWVRVLDGPSLGSFLIVGGKKMDSSNFGFRTSGPIILSDQDQAIFDAWTRVPQGVIELLKEIDLCNNGYARIDCLGKIARTSIVDGVALGYVKISQGPFGQNVIHRPELKMGVVNIEKSPSSESSLDNSDWESAIMERQDFESLRG